LIESCVLNIHVCGCSTNGNQGQRKSVLLQCTTLQTNCRNVHICKPLTSVQKLPSFIKWNSSILKKSNPWIS